MGEIRGGGGKAGRWVSKMSQRENVSYDGNAAKELAVSGSIFKEDGVLSSPPLQLPSLPASSPPSSRTDARTRREAHSHNPCSSTPSSSWNSRSMKWSSLPPLLSLFLSLSPIFLYPPFSLRLRCTHALRYCFCSLA